MPRRGETAVVPIDADGAGRGRPKSAHGPGHHGHQHRSGNRPRPPQQEFRPFRRWFPFLVPLFVVANVGLFALTMYVNDCPAHAAAADAAIGGAAQAQGCLLQPQLGRFAFQAYRENPLIGPSSATYSFSSADVLRALGLSSAPAAPRVGLDWHEWLPSLARKRIQI